MIVGGTGVVVVRGVAEGILVMVRVEMESVVVVVRGEVQGVVMVVVRVNWMENNKTEF